MVVLLQHPEAPLPAPGDPPERLVVQSGRTWFPGGDLTASAPPPFPVSHNITLTDISHGHRNPWINLRTPNWLECIRSEKSRLPGVIGHPRKVLVQATTRGWPRLLLRMTLPHTATIHYVPDRSIRRNTVEMSSQTTTPLGCNEPVPDHPVSGALAHVPESSDCQDLQFLYLHVKSLQYIKNMYIMVYKQIANMYWKINKT